MVDIVSDFFTLNKLLKCNLNNLEITLNNKHSGDIVVFAELEKFYPYMRVDGDCADSPVRLSHFRVHRMGKNEFYIEGDLT